jgi:hypothetical protein
MEALGGRGDIAPTHSRLLLLHQIWSRVSSGSIVFDYRLDDRAIGVRSLAGAKDFSFVLCVQTGSGAHPASYPLGTGGPFSGVKARPGRDADHSPHLVPRPWMSRSYTSDPPQAPPRSVVGLFTSFTLSNIFTHVWNFSFLMLPLLWKIFLK